MVKYHEQLWRLAYPKDAATKIVVNNNAQDSDNVTLQLTRERRNKGKRTKAAKVDVGKDEDKNARPALTISRNDLGRTK